MRRVHLFGAALLAVVLLTAGCGSASSGSASTTGPIKIGAVISLTGKFAPSAEYVQEGYKYWEKTVNDAGGINGRKVQLVIRDDQSDAAAAASLARSLVEKDGVFMILGPYGSGSTDTMAAVLEQLQVPMLGTIASDSAIWDRRSLKWSFQAFPSSDNDHESFVNVAADQGAKRIVIINEEAGFSIAAAAKGKALAEQKGMTVLSLSYPSTSKDFSSIVQKMKASNPDAISMGGYYAPSIALTKEMIGQGLNVPGYHFIQSSDGVTADALGPKVNGIFGRSSWEPQLKTPKNADFVKGYESQFNRAPSYHAAAAYSAGQVTEAAIKAVGTDRDKVRNFFATQSVETVQGTYKVNDKGQQTGFTYVGTQWQSGKKQIVWPSDQATAKAVWPKPAWS